MRISTLTNWAYVATVLLTGLSGVAFLTAAQAAREERAAVEEHLAMDILAEDLSLGVETLTDHARQYAVTGLPRHLAAYRREEQVLKGLDGALKRARAADPEPTERAAIDEAERALADLESIEDGAVAEVAAGRGGPARERLFGADHERAQAAVLAPLERFRSLVAVRTETRMREAQRFNDGASTVAKVSLGITALLFLAVLYFVLRRRITLPLVRMAGVVTRLARQDYDVEVTDGRRRDEIGDMAQAIQVFRDNGLERERLEAEQRSDQHIKDAILQMMHRLQACETREELADVVAVFAPQTFPMLAGVLYVLDERRNALAPVATWLEPERCNDGFPPNACWGLRRGRPHVSNGDDQDIACPHLGPAERRSRCVPLAAQGETVGLLYVEERPDSGFAPDRSLLFLDLMADNIALSLANLKLRERLADLASRDGLTGLHNRRSLDERLAALKRDEALTCLMLDIDHFKRFNDMFGHDAGDAVLQHAARIMEEQLGEAGTAYRFGGEEFTILLPGADEAAALAQAEALRLRVCEAQLAHHGRMLGQVTISAGLASAPLDGPPGTLLRQADAALLQAKAKGRNQVVTASQIVDPPGRSRGARRA